MTVLGIPGVILQVLNIFKGDLLPRPYRTERMSEPKKLGLSSAECVSEQRMRAPHKPSRV